MSQVFMGVMSALIAFGIVLFALSLDNWLRKSCSKGGNKMNEKVLGFREEDAEFEDGVNAYPKKKGFRYTGDYRIEESKLVPVVGLAEHKKKVEEAVKEERLCCQKEIRRLKSELQFKEDRISQLIVERDKGLWKTYRADKIRKQSKGETRKCFAGIVGLK